MGWNGRYDWKNVEDVVRDTVSGFSRDGVEILDEEARHHLDEGYVLVWFAMKRGEDSFVLCILIERHEGCIMRKIMDESIGPFYYDCPKRFLSMTKGFDSKWSKEWRQKVMAA